MKKAFSLIELIVVISIIALLTVISISGYSAQQKRSRETRRVADLGSLGLAVENYRTIRNAYPTGINTAYGESINTRLGTLVDNGLINVLPQDPRASDSTAQAFCQNYTYSTGWNKQTLPISSLDTGTRAFVLIARSELVGTTEGKHPLDSSVYATSAATWCEGQSAITVLTGPKQ